MAKQEKPLGLHAAVPLRLSLLLTGPEEKVLEPVIDDFAPSALRVVSVLEKAVRQSHRIVKGTFSHGSFEFVRPGRKDDEHENIDILSFCRSEFPALMSEWGGVLMASDHAIEFVVTGRFTALLFGVPREGARLCVRRGLMEASFLLPGERLDTIADAILKAEVMSEAARRWLAPVSREIVECNMLSA